MDSLRRTACGLLALLSAGCVSAEHRDYKTFQSFKDRHEISVVAISKGKIGIYPARDAKDPFNDVVTIFELTRSEYEANKGRIARVDISDSITVRDDGKTFGTYSHFAIRLDDGAVLEPKCLGVQVSPRTRREVAFSDPRIHFQRVYWGKEPKTAFLVKQAAAVPFEVVGVVTAVVTAPIDPWFWLAFEDWRRN
ncbi:MAG TPA: hypothetical protein VNI01_04015 [Elusimicrobiota bacterium]|jgi:hypothetical protein|nr:hypothetical protein [Elusimicrobiota bacterium]